MAKPDDPSVSLQHACAAISHSVLHEADERSERRSMLAEFVDAPGPVPSAAPLSRSFHPPPDFQPQLVEGTIARVSGAMIGFK